MICSSDLKFRWRGSNQTLWNTQWVIRFRTLIFHHLKNFLIGLWSFRDSRVPDRTKSQPTVKPSVGFYNIYAAVSPKYTYFNRLVNSNYIGSSVVDSYIPEIPAVGPWVRWCVNTTHQQVLSRRHVTSAAFQCQRSRWRVDYNRPCSQYMNMNRLLQLSPLLGGLMAESYE